MRNFIFAVAFLLLAVVPMTSYAGTSGCLIGAGAGGFGGAQIGSGKGQLAAVALGTLLGCGIGSSLQDHHSQRYHPSNQPGVMFTDRRVQYYPPQPQVTALPANCLQVREYQEEVTVGGKPAAAYGSACLMPDGSWLKIGPQKVY